MILLPDALALRCFFLFSFLFLFYQLPIISGLEDQKSSDIPFIKILFKIPSGVGVGMKPKSFSLPLNTTVAMLASHASSVVSAHVICCCSVCV
jgi:hypothetical protein